MSLSYLIQQDQHLNNLRYTSLTPPIIVRLFQAIYLWFAASLAWFQGKPYLTWEEAAVLFTDIVNFTEQSRQHRRKRSQAALYGYLLQHYQPALSRVVGDHQGQVVKFLGDGMMAIFPATEHSVQAAQGILQNLNRASQPLPAGVHCRFDTRLAIDTGPILRIIEGPPWRQQHDFLGDAVNNASHLANEGPANTLLVSANTYGHLVDKRDFSRSIALKSSKVCYKYSAS